MQDKLEYAVSREIEGGGGGGVRERVGVLKVWVALLSEVTVSRF